MTKENQLWQKVLDDLKVSVSKPIFQTLFSQTSLASLEKNIATIACPSSYIQSLVETRYYALLKDALDRQTKKNNSLVFVVKPQPKLQEPKTFGPLFEEEKDEKGKEAAIQAHLRGDFTFENFAVSSSNQLAYAAATAIVKNPGNAYNPLFLWGGVGVGKTHLMQAIGHAILSQKPKMKVIYCMSEEFTNEIINAIQTKTTRVFKERYRSAQVLLLDDVQFIAGKTTVQEEFFHTFNTIQREGGQIVLTSDRPPVEIAKLEERLRSRFEGGLTIDIAPPDFELRCAILLIKAGQRGVDLPMDVTQLIAANIESTRRLEGFLFRLLTEIETKKTPLTVELVNSLLGKGDQEKPKKTINPKEVFEAVASHFDLKVGQLRGKRRVKEIVLPRQVLMYLLRTELSLPLMEIGKLVGGRDHTTVMHGVEKITNLLSTNEDLRVDISEIKKGFYG